MDSMRNVIRFEEAITPIQNIASFMVLGTALFTVVALGLVVILFLRDRKKEIGIYRALGEKKGRVSTQLSLEIILPSLLGLTVALFIGNMIAHQIGQEMLLNDIAASQDFDWDDFGRTQAEHQLIWYLDDHLVTTIENYNVSLTRTTVVLFYTIGIVTVLISTMIPLTYTMKMDPKHILLAD